MSGLEITGVVLGALPLIISALEHYAEGVNIGKRYFRYKTKLRSLILQISTERGIFVNTVEQVLTGIVRTEHMAEFLNNVDGGIWKSKHIEAQLGSRLGSVYEVYMDNVKGMKLAIETMMDKLALDPKGKVRFDPKAHHMLSCETPSLPQA